MVMKLDLKHYTPRQYAVILLHDDFNYNNRQIAEIMEISITGVKYILENIKR